MKHKKLTRLAFGEVEIGYNYRVQALQAEWLDVSSLQVLRPPTDPEPTERRGGPFNYLGSPIRWSHVFDQLWTGLPLLKQFFMHCGGCIDGVGGIWAGVVSFALTYARYLSSEEAALGTFTMSAM